MDYIQVFLEICKEFKELVFLLIGIGITYYLTNYRENKLKRVQAKESRKKYLDLFVSELEGIMDSIDYILKEKKPTPYKIDYPGFEKRGTQ